MKKKIRLTFGILFLYFLNFFSYGTSIIEMPCDTSFGTDCDKCGYISFNVYEGYSYDFWDFFVNKEGKDYLISTSSSNSYANIVGSDNVDISYMLYNYIGFNDKGLTANYIDKNKGDNIVIFKILNFIWNRKNKQQYIGQNPIVGQINYVIKYYPIVEDGNWTKDDFEVKYLRANETCTEEGCSLDPLGGEGGWIIIPNMHVSIDLNNYKIHKECYKIRGSYCGDGIVDSGYEQCDNGQYNFDPSSGGEPQVVNGIACDNTCHIIQPQCGPAAKVYDYNDTNWNGDFCSNRGELSGNVPNFPSPGQTVSWICKLGNQTVSCSASRLKPSEPTPGGGGGGGGRVYTYCGDGRVQKPNSEGIYEQCDLGEEFNGDPTKQVPNRPGYYCDTNCQLQPIFSCEWIDPPSIQIGEYLFFWWKVENRNQFVEECNLSNIGKYKKDDAKCKFIIKNGNGEIDEIERYCFDDITNGELGYTLWNDFKNDYKTTFPESTSINNYDGVAYYWLSGNNFTSLGEYNVKLIGEKAKKCECTAEGCNWTTDYKQINWTNNCGMPFSVTRPYLIQNGSLVSTVNNDVLNDFYNLDGSKVVGPADTDLISSDNVVSSYDWNGVKGVINDFVKKYSKLAVKDVTITTLGINAKKVIGKEIYVIDGNGTNLNINSPNFSKPTTLIVKNAPIVNVNGDVTSQLMIVAPNSKIKFNYIDCDKSQIINGIYIAGEGFDTEKVINNDLNSQWCWDGRLIVNGSLIGSGIGNLWQKRRSVLKDWFNVTHDSKIQKIKNGGSLVINTNTNLWKNLPPGADELLQKIEIYKK